MDCMNKAAEEQWMQRLVVPYGTYEKATYRLYRYRRTHEPLFFFTTTVHDLAWCIDYLVKKFYELESLNRHFSIYITVAGKEYMVYKHYPSQPDFRIQNFINPVIKSNGI